MVPSFGLPKAVPEGSIPSAAPEVLRMRLQNSPDRHQPQQDQHGQRNGDSMPKAWPSDSSGSRIQHSSITGLSLLQLQNVQLKLESAALRCQFSEQQTQTTALAMRGPRQWSQSCFGTSVTGRCRHSWQTQDSFPHAFCASVKRRTLQLVKHIATAHLALAALHRSIGAAVWRVNVVAKSWRQSPGSRRESSSPEC